MRFKTSSAIEACWVIVMVLFSLSLIIGVLALVISGPDGFGDGDVTVPFELRRGDGNPLTYSPEPGEPKVLASTLVEVVVTDLNDSQQLKLSAPWLGTFALWLAGLWLVGGILRTTKDGDPFGPANVTRLRVLGVVLLVGAAFAGYVASFENEVVQSLQTESLRERVEASLPRGDISVGRYELPDEDADAFWIAAPGVAMLILAQVFAYGRRLRDEVEATV